MRILPRLLSVALLLTANINSFAQSGPLRGITPEDYFSFEFLSDPQLSPDGKLAAYVLTKVDRPQNRRNSTIWVVPTNGSRAPSQFTTSPQSSTSPRWSPDGKWLAFISSRPSADAAPTPAPTGGTPQTAEQTRGQVFLLSMNGGEAKRLTNLKNGVSLFRWSPDGTRLVVVSRIGPSDARTESRDRSDVRHYKNSSYKFNDTGWFDDRRTHLWIVDVPGGQAKQITEGNDWNDSDPQWSPDGARIAFVSNRTGKEYNENRNTDVWVVPATGGGLTKISDHDEADNSPRWSPDGKTIAFTGEIHDRDHPKIWLAPASGGVASVLAANGLDLIPTDLDWSADRSSLYFQAGVKGETHLFRVDRATKAIEQITKGARAVRNVDFHWPTRTMVYLVNDFKHLDDLYVANINGRDERKLTNLNENLWKQLSLADVERFSYKSADN